MALKVDFGYSQTKQDETAKYDLEKVMNTMDSFLPPIEKPAGLILKLAYYYAPGVRQRSHAVESPQRAVAGCVRAVLREDRQARQKN
jgi:hypothetical protein